MPKLSVVISAFNEEAKIVDCLKSVAFADEIILIDNSSTDQTVELAKKYTDTIYSQRNDPLNIDMQKNFGFSKATCEWIVSLDADERVTPELAEEIKKVLADRGEGKEINGYWIPRKNIIFGKWIEHTGWYPDFQLRLFKKGKGKYTSKHFHEDLAIEGEYAHLSHPILHYNFDTMSQFFSKHMQYAQNEAYYYRDNNYEFKPMDAIHMPVKEFISRFFAREGYKDGFHGLVLSLLMAVYHMMIFSFLWENHKFQSGEQDTILTQTEKEIQKAHNELHYWFLTEKIERSKNISKKVWLKLRRKFH